MSSNTQPIGYIDSGVGGLTVVKQALKQLPHESVVFVGDTARCPYGPRPSAQVVDFTFEMTKFLLKQNIKMLVIACNTATAATLPLLRAKLSIPVIGVILPGSRAAIKATRNNRIGVIGTEGTIKSQAYLKTIKGKNPDAQVYSIAAPKLVSVVESFAYHSAVAKKIVAESLTYFQLHPVDTLVMGCTHYPLLRPIIQNVMGNSVTLIDSGAETVSEVSTLLDYFDIANTSFEIPTTQTFYTSGSAATFREIAQDWLPLTNLDVQHIELGGN